MVPLLNEIAPPKKTLVKLCFFIITKRIWGPFWSWQCLCLFSKSMFIFLITVLQHIQNSEKDKRNSKYDFKGIAKFKTNVPMLFKWTSSQLNCFALVLFQNTSSKETTLINKKSLILFKCKGSWCHCSVLFFFENHLIYLNSLNTFQRFVV